MRNYEEIHARMKTDRDSGWVDHLLDDIANAPLVPEENIDRPSTEDLSEEQRLVLMYASRGLKEQEIADVTALTLFAVRSRLLRCRAKLAGKTTTHAVANAIRLGMIP